METAKKHKCKLDHQTSEPNQFRLQHIVYFDQCLLDMNDDQMPSYHTDFTLYSLQHVLALLGEHWSSAYCAVSTGPIGSLPFLALLWKRHRACGHGQSTLYGDGAAPS